MAEVGVGQWGITLRVARRAWGYWWNDEAILRPFNRLDDEVDPQMPHRIGYPMQLVSGAKMVRKALNDFVKLARRWDNGLERGGFEEAVARREILIYANRFGSLYGGEEGKQETLEDWLREGSRFLSLLEASRAARASIGSRELERFRGRVEVVDNGSAARFVYASGRAYAPKVLFVDGLDVMDREGERIDFTERASKASAKELAYIFVTNLINAQMVGALNFEPSKLDKTRFVVTPKNLISTLYLRVWLDTADAPEPVRECECGNVIQGARNRRYCSDACKQKRYRKRQAE